MVNMLYWNIRGGCGSSLFRNLRVVCRKVQPVLIVLSETKCETEDRLKGLLNLGFDCMSFVPSSGRSEGIVAAWNRLLVDVVVERTGSQFMHLSCDCRGGMKFLLSAIYVLPNASLKQGCGKS
ncbi:hypothetical protein K1719_026547 [Acacia pycnantha]|nr:hypothetical protein K1719_026547 [Acacia pycnantha]